MLCLALLLLSVYDAGVFIITTCMHTLLTERPVISALLANSKCFLSGRTVAVLPVYMFIHIL